MNSLIKQGAKMAMTAKHGHAIEGQRTRIYGIWRGFRQRCANPKATGFTDYGGRGIKVYPEWNNFEKFLEWATSNGYEDHLSIERRDVNLDYTPGNCYWATTTIQACNKRKRPNTKNNYTGVNRMRKKWQAVITYKGLHTCLGVFETELEAAEARDKYIKSNNLPHRLGLGV